jgi:hypothetical protein
LLAAAPLAAQKPGADDPERDHYRGQGISMCVAELRAVEGITPDDLEAVCGCAFDRFMPGRETAALPRIGPRRMIRLLAGPLVGCAVAQRPELGTAVARHVVAAPNAPAIEPAPPPVAAPTAAADDKRPLDPAAGGPGLDPSAWLDGLSVPSWLTGGRLPRWAWLPLGALALALLGLFFRRRDGDRDLDGPPPHMRARTDPPPRR